MDRNAPKRRKVGEHFWKFGFARASAYLGFWVPVIGLRKCCTKPLNPCQRASVVVGPHDRHFSEISVIGATNRSNWPKSVYIFLKVSVYILQEKKKKKPPVNGWRCLFPFWRTSLQVDVWSRGKGLQGMYVGLLVMLSDCGRSLKGKEIQISEWGEGFAKGGLQYADNAGMYPLKGFYEETRGRGNLAIFPVWGESNNSLFLRKKALKTHCFLGCIHWNVWGLHEATVQDAS
jgi:hypothetical protein